MELETSHDRYAFVIPPGPTPKPLMSSDNQTTDKLNQTSSIKTDMSTLASLITSTATTTSTTTTTTNGDRAGDPEAVDGDDIGDLGVEDVEELIRRLEAANGIADGVEGKLDGILEHLDGLLNSLEATGEAKENGGPANLQPDR